MRIESFIKNKLEIKSQFDNIHNKQVRSNDKSRLRSSEKRKILENVKKRINERKDEINIVDKDYLEETIKKIGWELIESEANNQYAYLMLNSTEKLELLELLIQDLFGFSVIEPLLNDHEITEIMINGPYKIFIEKHGKVSRAKDNKGNAIVFPNERDLRKVIDKIVAPINRKVDESDPIVDARLPDGSRVSIILNPVSLDGTSITIRKFPEKPFSMEELVEKGALPMNVSSLLKTMVRARYNILVSGGTGTGKTTFLNALSMFIPEDRRIVTVEDAAELKFNQVDNLVRLETRPPNLEQKGEITIRDLVRTALRMRPDQIIVGEVRGGEALDMLQAMNTGHDGSLSTAHANSAFDLLTRLETMVLMAGMELPVKAVRQQIGSAVDFIVHLKKMRDGSRIIEEIVEIRGMIDGEIVMEPIFKFSEDHMNSSEDKVIGTLSFTGENIESMNKFNSIGIRDLSEYMLA